MQVEKSPVVVKSGLKKEEAEELMSKLTAGEHHLLCVPFPETRLTQYLNACLTPLFAVAAGGKVTLE